jgi:hypothetical protein
VLSRHVIVTPTQIQGRIGMTDYLFDALQTLSYVDAAGVLRVWDSHLRTWAVRGRHLTGGTRLGIDN